MSSICEIDEMEFLGSFWRTRLTDDAEGGEEGGASGDRAGGDLLVADFSINAVRRLDMCEGQTIRVEIPSERLRVFPA